MPVGCCGLRCGFVLACFAVCASASTEVIQGYVYRAPDYDITRPSPGGERGTTTKNLTAGAITVSHLLINQQATNFTVGEALGYCVALRDGGPSQCQLTLQLASGTVQFGGILESSDGVSETSDVTVSPFALHAITGGTGLYTGATGYFQQTTESQRRNQNQNSTVTIRIDYK